MTAISKHFSRSEFACKCGCGQDTVDAELISVLESIREHFGAPVTVNSGNRCPAYNASVGGATHSQHVLSRAADITVDGYTPLVVHDYLDATHQGGLGSYDTFTHVDSRDGMARWDG
jgi:uncharacterized protein YcbK (DUF882 family)